MNKYTSNHFSNTVGTITLIALTMAAQGTYTVPRHEPRTEIKRDIVSSTYDQHRNLITGNFTVTIDPFDSSLAKAYQVLLNQSISPDKEIDSIISNNLWTLYEV